MARRKPTIHSAMPLASSRMFIGPLSELRVLNFFAPPIAALYLSFHLRLRFWVAVVVQPTPNVIVWAPSATAPFGAFAIIGREGALEMLRLKRWVMACAALFSAGCSLPVDSQAEYDKGIVFYGSNGTVYKVEWWSNRADASTQCPIVLHPKEGRDLDKSQFASPRAMRDIGGRTQNERDGKLDLMVSRPEMSIGCSYEHEKLVYVMVNVGGDSSGNASLTVNGKNVSLPTSEKKLFEILGEPSHFHQHKPTNWVD